VFWSTALKLDEQKSVMRALANVAVRALRRLH
jgi:hypothetical protein